MAHALKMAFDSIRPEVDMIGVDQVIDEAAAMVASQGPPGTQLH